MALPLLLAACGGNSAQMGGFTEVEAKAKVMESTTLERCAVQSGRLVLEVQRVLVREYPNTAVARLKNDKQPMLLMRVSGDRQPGRPPEVDLTPLLAPEDYAPGDPVRFFEGRRLLERPLRALSGRRLELRLAENDRTEAPKWVAYAHMVTGGAAAGGAIGIPTAPSGAADALIDVLRKVDKDDLVLFWSGEADAIAREVAGGRALQLKLATTRLVTIQGAALPSAELDVVFYVEPEAGCGGSK